MQQLFTEHLLNAAIGQLCNGSEEAHVPTSVMLMALVPPGLHPLEMERSVYLYCLWAWFGNLTCKLSL